MILQAAYNTEFNIFLFLFFFPTGVSPSHLTVPGT